VPKKRKRKTKKKTQKKINEKVIKNKEKVILPLYNTVLPSLNDG